MKLNYGCGEAKLEGFINIDSSELVKPDIICDIKKGNLPFKDEEIELIHCIHNLEHIELPFWPQLFSEFWRVLIPEGKLILAYPEFERCAINFIENSHGRRDWWRATLYGRQLYPGDYHVVPMITSEVIDALHCFGFNNIKAVPEPLEPYNTCLIAFKGQKALSREDVIRKEIFVQ